MEKKVKDNEKSSSSSIKSSSISEGIISSIKQNQMAGSQSKDLQSSRLESNSDAEEITWLIFESGEENQHFAVESKYVKELLRNNEIFPLPFVPAYIKGVLNCYGDPYAVLDFGRFFGEEFTDSKLFIILHDKNHICLQVKEINAFHNTKENEIQSIEGTGETSFLRGAISWNNTSIPIVDLESLVQKVRSELGNC